MMRASPSGVTFGGTKMTIHLNGTALETFMTGLVAGMMLVSIILVVVR